MSCFRCTPPLLVILVLLTGLPVAAEEAAIEQLVEQGYFWQSHNRWEEAAQTWRKLLRSRPGHPDALSGLGFYEVHAGHPDAALDYLERLTAAHPGHPNVEKLSKSIQKRAGSKQNALQKARELARTGQYKQAIEQYSIAFGGAQPEGALALEYYQTLGATEHGWDAARRALKRLAEGHPDELRYALAWAKHLTHRQSSRRDGIAHLQNLATHPEVAAEARAAWRQALLWLEPSHQDQDLLRSYLKIDAQDAAIQQRLQTLEQARTPRQDEAIRRGYQALDKGDLEDAEQNFKSVLQQRANDADALAGLGIVNLRRERFDKARVRLQRAIEAEPEKRGQWIKALEEARFWGQMEGVKQARAQRRLAQAEKLLRQMLRQDAYESITRVNLAQVLANRGKYREAEQQYRKLLNKESSHIEAQKGLALVLSKQDRHAEALALIEQLPEGSRAALANLGSRLRSARYQSQAKRLEAKGDYAGAQAALEQALLIAEGDPWVRLELTRFYRRQGDHQRARSLMEELARAEPDDVDAHHASALLSAEEGRYQEALQTLDQVPLSARTAEMNKLRTRVLAHIEVARALERAGQGHEQHAYRRLTAVQASLSEHPELVGVLADAWVKLGEETRALGLMRQALKQDSSPSRRLHYAWLLLATDQEVELSLLLKQLESTTQLTPAQREELSRLRVARALREADQMRQAGDLAAAYDILSPMMQKHPQDPRMLMLLGQLYADAAQPAKALQTYRAVLVTHAQHTDARRAAVGMAMRTGDYELAKQLIHQGLVQDPGNPKLHALAGHLARAQGNDAKAMEHFNKALQQVRGSSDRSRTGPRVQGRRDEQVFNPSPSSPDDVLGLSSQTTPDLEPAENTAATSGVPVPLTNTSSRTSLSGNAFQQRQDRWRNRGQERLVHQHGGLQLAAFTSTPSSFHEGIILPDSNPFRRGSRQPSDATPVAQEPRARDLNERHTALRNEILHEMESIRKNHSPEVATGLSLRARSGEEGLGELHDLELPLETNVSPGYRGRLTLRVIPVKLSAGDLDLDDFGKARRFGSNALDPSLPASDRISQDEHGVAIGAKYRYRDVAVDLGSTPLGFPVTRVVGGIRWTPRFEHWGFALEASRRAVTDSLLSYAGTEDPFSGATWGGVVSTGGRFDLSYTDEEYGLYANGAYYALEGESVASNDQLRLGAGLYWRALEDEDQRLTVGVDVTYFGYDKNLNHFTLGQGGYFSPQNYVSFGIPATWSGRQGKVAYSLTGYLGMQTFEEDVSPFFPDDPALQQRLEALSSSAPALKSSFNGQDKTGVSYSFSGNVAYQIQPKLSIGGNLSFDNARDFNEYAGMLYLRYFFEAQSSDVLFPPRGLEPFYVGRP